MKIFVTVGTHEQQMDRLFMEIENLNDKYEFITQIGYSNYIPKGYEWKRFIPHREMNLLMETSDIIITHGGPGSIFGALGCGKMPIVVPRQHQFEEHINNHQIDFARRLVAKGQVYIVIDIKDLHNTISLAVKNLEKVVNFQSNTENFCRNFSDLVLRI